MLVLVRLMPLDHLLQLMNLLRQFLDLHLQFLNFLVHPQRHGEMWLGKAMK